MKKFIFSLFSLLMLLLSLADLANADVLQNANGLCLDARGAPTSEGRKVSLWQCHGRVRQIWQFYPQRGDKAMIRGAYRACLDANAYDVVIKTCNYAFLENQLWYFVGNQLVHLRSGYCLTAMGENSKAKNGMPLKLRECKDLLNQQWIFAENIDFPGSPIKSQKNAPPPPPGIQEFPENPPIYYR